MNALRTSVLDQHLTDRDVLVLEDLEQYRLLTTRQLQRLHLPVRPLGDHASTSAATRGTTRILGGLESLGMIARLERRIGGMKYGSASAAWHLGGAGDRYLRARRGDPARRRYGEPGLVFVTHTLAVADIAVTLRERAGAGHFDLLELTAEPTCWRAFTGAAGEAVTLKPDLFSVTADASTETHSFVEVDLGTEHLPAVLRKCRVYQQYERTGIEQAAHGLFPAVVWLVPSVKRADAIRGAIDADRSLDASLFWVTTSEQALDQFAPYGGEHTT